MKHFRKRYLLQALLCCLLFTGCIKEDQSACPPSHNVTLNFRYRYEGIGGDLFGQRVENVEVEVYDMQGNLVSETHIDQAALTALQGACLSLEPGQYRIVCWGNIFTHTIFQSKQKLDDALVLHTDRTSQSSDSDDPMFYAPRIHDLANPDADSFILTVPAQGTVEETIDFTAAHNTIEVLVKGLTGQPQIEVTQLASAYNFCMQTLADKPMCFVQTTHTETRGTDYAVATYHTALFQQENSIEIHIKKPATSELLYTVNLRQFLTDNAIMLHPTDWNKISILIEFNDLGMVVGISPWKGTNVTPGVD